MYKFYLFILLFSALNLQAANRFWVASGASNWNNSANWSTTSGGIGGASVPGAADVAIFNNAALGNCSIDINVAVLGIQFSTGYTGTLTQNAFTITTGSSGWSQAAGTFNGSASNITNNGVMNLTGGIFNSTSGTLFQLNNLTRTSGTFNHNNGRVTFGVFGITTFVSGVFSFYDLETNGTGLILDLNNTTQSVLNNFYFTNTGVARLQNGNINLHKDLINTNTRNNIHGHINFNINFVGTGNQMITGTATRFLGRLPSLVINKSSGNVILKDNITLENDFTVTAGTIDYASFSNRMIFIHDKTITGVFDLGEAEFYSTGMTFTFGAGTNININNNLFLGGTNILRLRGTANLNAKADIDCSAMTYTGANAHGAGVNLVINGTTNQNFIGGLMYSMRLPNIIINKASGTLFLKDFINSENDWTYTTGTIDYTSFTNRVVFVGNKTISGSHNLGEVQFDGFSFVYTISSGSVITANSTLYFTGNSLLRINTGTIKALADIDCSAMTYTGSNGHTNGTLSIEGTADQNIIGGAIYTMRLPNIVINKPSGTLFLKNFVNSENNWTYTTGTIDYTSFTNRVVFVGNKTISGSHQLGEVQFEGISSIYTITASTVITVTSTLYFTGNSVLRINTGAIKALADIDCSGMTYTGSNGHTNGTLSIEGTVDQNIIGGAIYTMRLPNIVINKPSGTLFLKNFINSENNWTYTTGTIDYTSFTNRVVFVGNKTISGSHQLGEVQFEGISSIYTINASTVITVTSTLYFTGNNVLRINTGTIKALADIDCSGMTYAAGNGHVNGTILIEGTVDQNFIGGAIYTMRLPNIVINKPSGTLFLKNFVNSESNWTYTTGTIDYTSFSNRVVYVGTKSITGTLSLGAVQFEGISSVYTITAGTVITVTSTLYFTGNNVLRINTGTIKALADIDCSGMTYAAGNGHLNGTILIEGTVDQNFIGGAIYTMRLPNIVINKASGNLILKNFINSESNWTYTTGTIDYTSFYNRVVFVGSKTITGTHNLAEVQFNGASDIYTIASGTTVTANNTLYFTGNNVLRILTGTIEAKGDISCVGMTYNLNNSHTGLLRINGTTDQTIFGNTSRYLCRLPNVLIQKTSGNLFLKDFITVEKNWTYVSGNIDYSTFSNRVIFIGVKSVSGTHDLGEIEIYGNGTYTVPVADVITANRTLFVTGNGPFPIAGGKFAAKADIDLTQNIETPTNGHTGAFLINGTSDQHIFGNPRLECKLPSVLINKPSGTLILHDNINVEGNWTYTSGTIDWFSNTNRVIFIGNKSISGTHDLGETEFYSSNNNFNVISPAVITSNLNCYINGPGTFQFSGGGKFALKSDLIVQSNIFVSAVHNMNFEFNGTTDQNFDGPATIYNSTLPTIIINKAAGNLFLKDNITVQGNWIYTQGTVDYFTNLNKVIFRDTKTISGTHTLGNVEVYGSGIYTLPSGTILQVDSLLEFTSTGQFRIVTGTIEANNDVLVSNTFVGIQNHSGILRFTGNQNQVFDGVKTLNVARLPTIEINKSGGTLSLVDTLNVEGNWTYMSGIVDPGLNEVAFYTAKTLDCEGTSSTMSFYNMSLNDATIRSMQGDVLVSNNCMLKNGILRLNKNRLTVTKNATNTISRTTGYIISEETDNEAKVTWNTGSLMGNYVFPFGRVTGEYIPFTFNLTAGNAGNVTISTYPTGNPNIPYPVSPDPVLYLYDNHGHNNSDNVVNRFWQIDKDGLDGTATLTFVYANNEWDVTEPNYQAQRYNKILNLWENPYPGQTRSLAANSVTVPNVTTFSPWTLSTTTSPLPLTLINFNALLLIDEVELTWETKNESNMTYEIEKSLDLINFELISTEDGKGGMSNNYKSLDHNLVIGKNYYRLKMIDLNGTISYSQIEEINYTPTQFSLYPNPAQNYVSIELNQNSIATIDIFDALGKLVYTHQTTEKTIWIQTKQWSKGIYYVKVNDNITKLLID